MDFTGKNPDSSKYIGIFLRGKLGERGGSEREHGVERVDSTVTKSGFQGGKEGQARRASLEQVERSMSG